MTQSFRRRTWAEIDLDALSLNYQFVRESTSSKICCVIKANGYGHGAVEIAKRLDIIGADYFAVSNIEEALQLRNSQIKKPILILGYTPSECAKILYKENISQCVYSLDYAKKLNSQGYKIKAHIKLDTGMGRIGFSCKESNRGIEDALKACLLPNILTEGIFMHFSVADEGKNGEEYTKRQFNYFRRGYQYLESQGVHFDIHHCANSAAIFDYPEYHLDMVRAGIVLYGLRPSGNANKIPEIRPVMTLKSVISYLKEIEIGDSISYGRTFTADKKMKIATVPIGYADGFYRANGNQKYCVLVNNQYAPIVGRVCMDQMMVDVTHIDCCCEDQVVVFGVDRYASADNLARINRTINYEVVCDVGERVPRAYIVDGKITTWKDNLVEFYE